MNGSGLMFPYIYINSIQLHDYVSNIYNLIYAVYFI